MFNRDSTHKEYPDIKWFDARLWWRLNIPAQWRPWLCRQGSMTALLEKTFNASPSIQVCHESYHFMANQHHQVLPIRQSRRCFCRQVTISIAGVNCIVANTFVPDQQSAHSLFPIIKKLGARSIGKLLFNQLKLKRESLKIGCLKNDQEPTRWFRRSVFYYHAQPVVILEELLPTLVDNLVVDDSNCQGDNTSYAQTQ